ncbi:MAG: CopG family transcriptional regulator [Pseudomonadota bacterium]
MTRQSISLTRPNDEWLKGQIEAEEFSSKSELINDLIRRERERQAERDYIRAKLEAAEESVREHGWVEKPWEDMMAEFKAKAKADGLL